MTIQPDDHHPKTASASSGDEQHCRLIGRRRSSNVNICERIWRGCRVLLALAECNETNQDHDRNASPIP
jgi:hypothetical protein